MKKISGSLPVYIENKACADRMSPVFLSDADYAQATQCLVLLCADILIVNKRRRTFYLARRKSRPAQNWQWFIGGRRKWGERPLKSAARCFERETGLRCTPSWFQYVATNEYFFVDREQVPHEKGTHSVAQTYFIELPEAVLKLITLDPKEYHESGLEEFKFEDLSRLKLKQPVKDIVHKTFQILETIDV
jgi:ADP-ribose pyrophosphatase YjhB (NUDIX family)